MIWSHLIKFDSVVNNIIFHFLFDTIYIEHTYIYIRIYILCIPHGGDQQVTVAGRASFFVCSRLVLQTETQCESLRRSRETPPSLCCKIQLSNRSTIASDSE